MKISKLTSASIIVLILAGLGVATYLTFLHYTSGSAACGVMETFSKCDVVLQSRYAEIFGVPVALFGVIFYATLLFVLIKIVYKKDKLFIDLMFTLEVFGVIFSILLTYIQLLVIHALCPYCLSSAIITAILFFLSLYLKKKQL